MRMNFGETLNIGRGVKIESRDPEFAMGSKCCKCNQADKIYGDASLHNEEGQKEYHTQDCSFYTVATNPKRIGGTGVVVQPIRPSRIKMGHQFPEFLRELSDLAVKVGTRTRFLVEIRSSSTLKVSWYQNETKVVESEGLSIVNEGNFYCVDVSPVIPESEGRWTCVAENLSGRSSCSCHLRVSIPRSYKSPEFVQGLRAVLTEAGTVSLECKVVGIPAPTLKWFKDNKEIKAGDIFALTASASDPTSLGTYTCEASNCMGRAISSSKVHIQNKNIPVIIQELVDHKARVGEIHTLAITLIQPYPVKIEWYNKDVLTLTTDSKIQSFSKEDGIASICLSPLNLEDDGEWKVVLVNEDGLCSSSSCHLSIVIPKNYRKPRFLENLKAVLTEEGLVSFECKVVGFPTPHLYWFKDGNELRPGDVYQLSGTNSLGVYSCVAKNCMGTSESNAELTLEDIQHQLSDEERKQLLDRTIHPPKFSKGLKSIEGKLNDKLRLTVESTEQITTTWYRENDVILENEKYKMCSEPPGHYHLDIETLELIDEAEWKCLGINEYGHSMTSCRVSVLVPPHYRKPKFLEPLRAVLSNEGTVNLECKVIGVPQPQLKWYKDGVELKAGDIHKIISGEGGSCCLGTYTCSAFNCMGSVSSSAALLGFEEKQLERKVEEPKFDFEPLSTIAEERTSQMQSIYETPSDKSISLSIDGKEVSVSLYETPDLTENDAKQIIEMFANQCSEHVSEQNLLTLPSLRFMRETSTSGRILMEAVVIDVTSFNEFESAKSDQTENDIDELSEELDNIKRPLIVQENEELFDLASLTEEDYFDNAELRDSSLATPIVQDDLQLCVEMEEADGGFPPAALTELESRSQENLDYAGESIASYHLFPLERQQVHDFETVESIESDKMDQFERMVSNLVENHSLDVQENSHLSQVGELSSFGDTSTNVFVGFIPNEAYEVDNGGHFEHFDSFNAQDEEEVQAAETDLSLQQRQAQIIQLQQHLSNLGGAFMQQDMDYGTRADMVASELFPLIPSQVYIEEGVETLSEIESMGTFGLLDVEEEFLQSPSVSRGIEQEAIHIPDVTGQNQQQIDQQPVPPPRASKSGLKEQVSVRETIIEGPDSEIDETIAEETEFQVVKSEEEDLQTAIARYACTACLQEAAAAEITTQSFPSESTLPGKNINLGKVQNDSKETIPSFKGSRESQGDLDVQDAVGILMAELESIRKEFSTSLDLPILPEEKVPETAQAIAAEVEQKKKKSEDKQRKFILTPPNSSEESLVSGSELVAEELIQDENQLQKAEVKASSGSQGDEVLMTRTEFRIAPVQKPEVVTEEVTAISTDASDSNNGSLKKPKQVALVLSSELTHDEMGNVQEIGQVSSQFMPEVQVEVDDTNLEMLENQNQMDTDDENNKAEAFKQIAGKKAETEKEKVEGEQKNAEEKFDAENKKVEAGKEKTKEKVEAEKKKVEADEKKAETEKKNVEADKKISGEKAETEKKKVEANKKKAEEVEAEKKKVEAEKNKNEAVKKKLEEKPEAEKKKAEVDKKIGEEKAEVEKEKVEEKSEGENKRVAVDKVKPETEMKKVEADKENPETQMKKAEAEKKKIEVDKEKAETEKKKFDAEKKIGEEKDNVEKKKVDTEMKKAEDEKKIVETDKEKTDTENKKVETGKKKTEGKAEAEKNRVEADKKKTEEKAEADSEIADTGLKKVEEDKKIAEEKSEFENKKVETDKKKAETEKIKVEFDTGKDEIEKNEDDGDKINAEEKAKAENKKLETDKEKAQPEMKEVEADKKQAEVKSEPENKNVEADKKKVKTEKEKVDADKKTTEAEKNKVEADKEKVETEKKKIEADKKKAEDIAEAEKKQVEADKKKAEDIAEAEKKKFEADKKKAEDIAEAEKNKVETEKKKVETDKKKAEEKAEAEKKKAEAEIEKKKVEDNKKTADEKAEAEKKKIETDKDKAETEKLKLKAEDKKKAEDIAEAEKKKLEADREKAETEKKKDEADKKKGEGEKKKVEADEEKAETEKKKVEIDRKKAEDKAEAEKKKVDAETEKKKVEDDKKKAEEKAEAEKKKVEADKDKNETEKKKLTADKKKAEDIAEAEKKKVTADKEKAETEKKKVEADKKKTEDKAEAEKKKVEADKGKAETEKKKVADKAEAEKKKADADKEKAETEKKKIDADKKKAEDKAETEKKVEADKEKAETEKKKVDADKKKVEADKEKAETEKKKVDADKKKTEEKTEAEKKKVEADKEKAETEKKKVDADKKKAEDKAEVENEKVEADKDKNETEKKKLTADKKKVEDIAEAEKKKVEADKEKAETEKKKVDADKKKPKDKAEADADKKKAEDKAEGEEKKVEAEAEKKNVEAVKKNAEDKAEAEKKKVEADEGNAEAEKNNVEAVKKKAEDEAEAEKKKVKAENEKKKAEADKKEAEDKGEAEMKKVEAETEKKKVEEDKKPAKDKAEAEKKKVEADKEKAETEKKIEADKKKAEAEKKNVEGNKKKAEEKAEAEKKKAEENAEAEKKNVEADNQKGDNEKKKLDAEKIKAEADKEKAQPEAKKAEADKKKAEEKNEAENKKVEADTEKGEIEMEKIDADKKITEAKKKKVETDKKKAEEEVEAGKKKVESDKKITEAEKNKLETEKKKTEEKADAGKKKIETEKKETEEKAEAEKKIVENNKKQTKEKPEVDTETAEAEKKKVEADKKNADEKAEIEKKRVEGDKKTAEEKKVEADKVKADTEKKVEADKKKAEDKIEKNKVEVDIEKKKVMKVETDKERTEAEKQKVEADKKTAEEKSVAEKKIVEADNTKAEGKGEVDKKKVEDDKKIVAEKSEADKKKSIEEAVAEKKKVEEDKKIVEEKDEKRKTSLKNEVDRADVEKASEKAEKSDAEIVNPNIENTKTGEKADENVKAVVKTEDAKLQEAPSVEIVTKLCPLEPNIVKKTTDSSIIPENVHCFKTSEIEDNMDVEDVVGILMAELESIRKEFSASLDLPSPSDENVSETKQSEEMQGIKSVPAEPEKSETVDKPKKSILIPQNPTEESLVPGSRSELVAEEIIQDETQLQKAEVKAPSSSQGDEVLMPHTESRIAPVQKPEVVTEEATSISTDASDSNNGSLKKSKQVALVLSSELTQEVMGNVQEIGQVPSQSMPETKVEVDDTNLEILQKQNQMVTDAEKAESLVENEEAEPEKETMSKKKQAEAEKEKVEVEVMKAKENLEVEDVKAKENLEVEKKKPVSPSHEKMKDNEKYEVEKTSSIEKKIAEEKAETEKEKKVEVDKKVEEKSETEKKKAEKPEAEKKKLEADTKIAEEKAEPDKDKPQASKKTAEEKVETEIKRVASDKKKAEEDKTDVETEIKLKKIIENNGEKPKYDAKIEADKNTFEKKSVVDKVRTGSIIECEGKDEMEVNLLSTAKNLPKLNESSEIEKKPTTTRPEMKSTSKTMEDSERKELYGPYQQVNNGFSKSFKNGESKPKNQEIVVPTKTYKNGSGIQPRESMTLPYKSDSSRSVPNIPKYTKSLDYTARKLAHTIGEYSGEKLDKYTYRSGHCGSQDSIISNGRPYLHSPQGHEVPSFIGSDWKLPPVQEQEPIEWKTFKYDKHRRLGYDPDMHFEPIVDETVGGKEWTSFSRPQYSDHESQLHRFREPIRSLSKIHHHDFPTKDNEPGHLSSDWAREKSKWELKEEVRLQARIDTLERTRQHIQAMKLESEKKMIEKRLKREAIIADFSKKMIEIENNRSQEPFSGMPSVLTVPSKGYSYFTDEVCSSRDASKRPRFSLKLQDRVVSHSSNVKLTCTVLGHPLPQLQFYKNGLPISSNGLKIIITNSSGVASLNIMNTMKEDIAEYTCFARNMYGKAATSCILTVVGDIEKKPQPPKFTRPITETQFRDVDEMVLECSVIGYPSPIVQWLRDEQVITPFGSHGMGRYNSTVTVDGRCRLYIHEIKDSDSGKYTCVARNNSWFDETSTAVNVIGKPVPPPRHPLRQEFPATVSSIPERPRAGTPMVSTAAPFFIEHPDTTVTITEGEDLILTCRVGGDPKPRVNLYRGCRDVSLQPRGFRETLGDSVRFTLRRVELMDAGRMTLEAKNLYGIERFVVSLKLLKAEKRARSMTPALFGSQCRPSYGMSDYNRRHFSSGVPGKLSEPIASELGPSWVSLRWTRPESPAPILAYKIEAWDTSEGARWVTLGMSPIPSFEAFHLRPRREYLFRVTPRNRFGWGESVATKLPVCVRDKCEMPDFVKMLPCRVKVLRGTLLSLDCELRGSPKPIVKWLQNGFEIFGESNENISIPVDSDFHLTCEATNSMGHVASFCSVIVVDDSNVAEADLLLRTISTSPEFTMRLRDRKIQLGHPLRLTCQVGGVGRIEVKWEKDSLDITDTTYSFQDKNFYTLEKSNLKLEDTGIYRARAINEFGEVACSCSVVVCTDYSVLPRWIKTLRDYVKVIEGGIIVIEGQCQAWPSVSVKWFKDSNRLRCHFNRRFRFELDTHGHISLVIQNSNQNDSGIYTAVVENEIGSIESICCVEVIGEDEDIEKKLSSSSTITVEKIPSAPRFLQKPMAMSVLEGDTVVIECSVDAYPRPEVVWLRDWLNPSYYKDGEHYELESDGETNYRLVIPCVKIDYTGSYTVFARNSLGSCKAIVSMQVGARIDGGRSTIQVGPTLKIPRILQPITNIRCCDGDSVTLLFKAEGEDLTYIWDKNGKVISSKDTNEDFLINGCQLTILKVYGEDEGTYRCKISNALGTAETKACLIVDASIADTTTLIPSDEIANEIAQTVTSVPSHRHTISHPQRPLHYQRPPKFYVLPHNRIANQGDNVRFQCSVREATITTWERDNKTIIPSKRYSRREEDDIRVLEILNVTQADAGIYRITLENHCGRVVANIRLDVVGRSRGGERMRAWSSSPVDNGRRGNVWDDQNDQEDESKDII